MPRLTHRFSAPLDGGLVDVGDGTDRVREIEINPGDVASEPFWLRTSSGIVYGPLTAPWRGTIPDGGVELLSSDPNVTAPVGGPPWAFEDFSQYADTADLRLDNPDGASGTPDSENSRNCWRFSENIDQVHLETGFGLDIDGYNLTQCMRYTFNDPGGYPKRRWWTYDKYNTAWWEIYFMLGPNFHTDSLDSCDRTGSQADWKMFLWDANESSGQAGRYSFKMGKFGEQVVASYPGFDDDPKFADEPVGGQAQLHSQGYGVSYFRGTGWHRLRYGFYMDPTPLASWRRIEIDGDLVVDDTGLTVDSRVTNCDSIVTANYNRTPCASADYPSPFYVWFGRFAVYDEDPGWWSPSLPYVKKLT